MNKRSVRFSVLMVFLAIFLGFGVSFVTPKPVRADALGDFIQRMSLGDFIRGLFGLPPSGGTSPAPLPPEPTINPAPNSPGDGAACFYNVKLINANGEAEPSAMQTGTLETGGCRTPGIRELVPSYYTQGSTAINRPEWPCTDATYVGQNCTQGIVTGQFVCLGGPAHEIKGCYNRTSGAYQRVSVTPLNPTNTPMPEPSNTPRPPTNTPMPEPSNTPIPGATNTPTPDLFFPSYCGCQATFRFNEPAGYCSGPDECGSPDIRNGRVVSIRTDENGNCTQTDYYCSTNGIPPAGNCNCVVDKSVDYTLLLPSEQSCLGRNRVGARCYLPSDYQLDDTGIKNTWVDGKCLKHLYRCPSTLPTNTPMPEPSNTPAPTNPVNTPCYYNVKLIDASGGALPSALQTGNTESGGCRTPGVRELVPSYYTQSSSSTNRPEWPCTDATYVGQNCTQGIVTGQFVCMGGPLHEIKGCYNRSSGAYQRVSVTSLGPTNTPMPNPTNTPPAAYGSFDEWTEAFRRYLYNYSQYPVSLSDLEDWRNNIPLLITPTPTPIP